MSKFLLLPYKIAQHYRILGFQGLKLLFFRGLGSGDLMRIKLSKIKSTIFLRKNTTDLTVFYQVFLAKSYAIRIIEEPKVIIDCGANIGMSTVFFKNRFPNAKVIAVEPETRNFELLKKNTEVYKDMVCLNKGIWSDSAPLKIFNDQSGEWGFMVKEMISKTEDTIDAISINDIISDFELKQIDILKVDIEGSEKEMFEKNFEQWLPLVKILIIELHDGLRAGSSKSFFKSICKYDFNLYRNNENFIIYFKKEISKPI